MIRSEMDRLLRENGFYDNDNEYYVSFNDKKEYICDFISNILNPIAKGEVYVEANMQECSLTISWIDNDESTHLESWLLGWR